MSFPAQCAVRVRGLNLFVQFSQLFSIMRYWQAFEKARSTRTASHKPSRVLNDRAFRALFGFVPLVAHVTRAIGLRRLDLDMPSPTLTSKTADSVSAGMQVFCVGDQRSFVERTWQCLP